MSDKEKSDWDKAFDREYKDITPLEALNQSQDVAEEYGIEALLQLEQFRRLARKLADLTEADIVSWANLKAGTGDPKKFELFENRARNIKLMCHKFFSLEDLKPTVN